MSVPSKRIWPDVRWISRNTTRPVVDLPHPDSPDQSERLAGIDVERHLGHRLDLGDLPAEQAAADARSS